MIFKSESYRGLFPGTNLLTFEQMGIISNSQRLWSQLTYWIRSLIMSTNRDMARQPSIINRLYIGVSRDFYNYFRAIYGPETAQQLSNLISSFIISVWKLTESIRDNNIDYINFYTVELYKNADALASFFSTVNTYWNESYWKSILYQYIRLLIDQIVAVKGEQFDREIDIAGRVEDQIAVIGNYMASGLIASYLPQTQPQVINK